MTDILEQSFDNAGNGAQGDAVERARTLIGQASGHAIMVTNTRVSRGPLYNGDLYEQVMENLDNAQTLIASIQDNGTAQELLIQVAHAYNALPEGEETMFSALETAYQRDADDMTPLLDFVNDRLSEKKTGMLMNSIMGLEGRIDAIQDGQNRSRLLFNQDDFKNLDESDRMLNASIDALRRFADKVQARVEEKSSFVPDGFVR